MPNQEIMTRTDVKVAIRPALFVCIVAVRGFQPRTATTFALPACFGCWNHRPNGTEPGAERKQYTKRFIRGPAMII